jgi:hypothetical protein
MYFAHEITHKLHFSIGVAYADMASQADTS